MAFRRGLEVAAVLLVTVVAAGLRFYRLDAAPTGLYHDEAINGVLGYFILHGNRSLFFGEREGLFMYLLAQALATFGHGETSLRIVSATLGVATVPALYLTARVAYGPRVALLAATLLATSYWHVSISRTVFRAITLPLAETLAFLFLWLALRARGRRARFALFVVAGLALGLVMYTYIAGRVVPLLAAVFLLTLLVWERPRLAPAWATLPAYGVAALCVFAPLGAFFLEHSSAFWGRAGEVAVAGEATASWSVYFDNIARVAGMFLIAGDANWRHNLAGLPVFDPLSGAAFVLGVGVCIASLRRPESRFLILWAGTMLVPTIAAAEAPHYLRAIGALPALCLLAALGYATAVEWLGRQAARRRELPRLIPYAGLVVALLSLSALATAATYFGDWSQRPETFAAFDGPLSSAGRYLASSAAWRESAAGRNDHFLTTRFWQDKTALMFYLWPWLRGADRDDMGGTRLGSRWFDESRALPLRPDGGVYVAADQDAWALAELARTYGDGNYEIRNPILDPAGRPAFVVASTRASPAAAGSAAPLATFGGVLALEDYRLPEAASPGSAAEVVTRWRLLDAPATWRQTDKAPAVFVHVLDADGSLLAVDEGLGFHPVDWVPGEYLALRHLLNLPPGTAPGSYEVVIGVSDPQGKRLSPSPTRRDDGAVALDANLLVAPGVPSQEPAALDVALEQRFGEDLALLGAQFLGGREVAPGETLKVALFWRALADVAADYEVALALAADDGEVVASASAQPAFGRYPTSRWRSGELVRDPRALSVSPRAEGGPHRLMLTVSDLRSGRQFGPVEIARVNVRAVARAFVAPAMDHPLPSPINFGGVVELLGYDLQDTAARPGGKVRIVLYWRCLAESERRYKVFVHLLSAAGEVAAQSDAEPAGGARPLTSWIVGEVVADPHEFPLPEGLAGGEYPLEVGLYEASELTRLPVLGPQGTQVDTRLLLPALRLLK